MWWGGFSEPDKLEDSLRLYQVLIPMWWGGFSESFGSDNIYHNEVLIPMWWGGFSENGWEVDCERTFGLNPHVVGRFFRGSCKKQSRWNGTSLNPHVVGRFFRGDNPEYIATQRGVLIPMWWGGFSESGGVFSLLNSAA